MSTIRRSLELDVGDTFYHGADILRVKAVGPMFSDEEQGNFADLFVLDVKTGVRFWCPLKSTTLVYLVK